MNRCIFSAVLPCWIVGSELSFSPIITCSPTMKKTQHAYTHINGNVYIIYKMHMLLTYTVHLYSLIMMRFIGSISSSQVTLTLSWNSVKFWAFSASRLVDWQNVQQSGDCEDLQLLNGTRLPQTLPPALACCLLQGDLPLFVPKSETIISTNCVGTTCHMQDNYTKCT